MHGERPRGNHNLGQALRQWECRNATWHAREPVVLQSGSGSMVQDCDGRSYIDMCSGFGALALGHNDHAVLAALRSDPAPLMHGLGDVLASRAKVELLETLHRVLPANLQRSMLVLGGAQAVEAAIKTAVLAKKKPGIISFRGAYHGMDLGALSLTWRDDFRAPFRSWIAGEHVVHLDFGCSPEVIAQAARAMPGGAAACIVEPIQGRGGVILPPAGWLQAVRRCCEAEGMLLILDEILTGFGRTGRMFFAHEVPCDLLCIGKSLGGGMPLSALCGTAEVMESWPDCVSESLHTGTYFGHPLSCRVAQVTVEQIVAQRLDERARTVGTAWQKELQDRLGTHPLVKTIRGEGLMLAIEFAKPGLGAVLMEKLLPKGVLAIPSGPEGCCLQLTPALNVPVELLAKVVDALDQVLGELT